MATPQVLPPDQDSISLRNALISVSVVLTGVASIVLGLRMYARAVLVRRVGWTDWAMVFAWFWTVGYLVMLLIGATHGMGFHGASLTFPQMITIVQITLPIEIAYYLIVAAIKISILLFYLQLGVDQTFHRLCKGTIWFLVVMHVVAIIVCLTQCIPLRKMWDLTLTVPGTCIDTTAFFYTTSTLNIVTDIWIIGLPVRTLASIQRPKSEKIVLIAVFGMGVFACIASIVRLYSLRLYTQSKDPFYDAAPINIWSMVEVTVAIVCASIPSIKPLLSKSQRTKFKQSSATNGRYMKHGVGSDPAEASLRKTSPWTGSENNSIRYPESSRDNKDFELGITPTQH